MNHTILSLALLVTLIAQSLFCSEEQERLSQGRSQHIFIVDYTRDSYAIAQAIDFDQKNYVDIKAETDANNNKIIKAGIKTIENLGRTWINHLGLNSPIFIVGINSPSIDVDSSHRWAIVANALIQQEKYYGWSKNPDCVFNKPSQQAQKLLSAIEQSKIRIAQPILYDLYDIANKKK